KIDGVLVGSGATGNTIGGTTAGARNVISGNLISDIGSGVEIGGPGTSGNHVVGNYIGVDPSGAAALPNRDGVVIGKGATDNQIGGTTPGERNVISGNHRPSARYNARVGVLIVACCGSPVSDNTLAGNYIGTDSTGMTAVPNDIGILVENAGP